MKYLLHDDETMTVLSIEDDAVEDCMEDETVFGGPYDTFAEAKRELREETRLRRLSATQNDQAARSLTQEDVQPYF